MFAEPTSSGVEVISYGAATVAIILVVVVVAIVIIKILEARQ